MPCAPNTDTSPNGLTSREPSLHWLSIQLLLFPGIIDKDSSLRIGIWVPCFFGCNENDHVREPLLTDSAGGCGMCRVSGWCYDPTVESIETVGALRTCCTSYMVKWIPVSWIPCFFGCDENDHVREPLWPILQVGAACVVLVVGAMTQLLNLSRRWAHYERVARLIWWNGYLFPEYHVFLVVMRTTMCGSHYDRFCRWVRHVSC
mgnify:CR=1 FL=1